MDKRFVLKMLFVMITLPIWFVIIWALEKQNYTLAGPLAAVNLVLTLTLGRAAIKKDDPLGIRKK
jgi:NADH:ubiquinone oxidoreductase subunit 3 (subunit A)